MSSAGITRQYVFTLFFNGRGARGSEWAEETRGKALTFLTRSFQDRAKFACIARDKVKGNGSNTLTLKGYVNFKSPCALVHAKRLLGKYSHVKTAFFGDLVSLFRLCLVDRDLVVIGRLPKRGNSIRKMESYATDPAFIKKVIIDSLDNMDRDKEDDVEPRLSDKEEVNGDEL